METVIDLAARKKKEATLSFIRGNIAPDTKISTPPPTTEPRGQLLQDLTLNGQFAIPTTALINEQVPNTKGMILWLCNRGLLSIYRMHFVPAGTTVGPSFTPSAPGSSTGWNRGLSGPLLDKVPNEPQNTNLASNPSLYTMTFNQELALPVYSEWPPGNILVNGISSVVSSAVQWNATEVVNISPSSIARDLAYTRLYSGIIQAEAGTFGIDDTTLTGTFSCAAIQDTRNICQTNFGAFDVSSLVQSAELPKDTHRHIPMSDGVVALLGFDIPTDFTPPDADTTIQVEGQQQNYNFIPPSPYVQANGKQTLIEGGTMFVDIFNQIYGTYGAWATAYDLQFAAYWITPWNITATTNTVFPVSGSTVTQINVGPIGECNALKIKINVGCLCMANGTAAGPPTTDIPVVFNVIASHYFATCGTNGSIYYTTVTDQQQLATIAAREIYGNNVTNKQGFQNNPGNVSQIPGNGYPQNTQVQAGGYGYSVEFDASLIRTSFTREGKYLGTFIAFTALPQSYFNLGTGIITVTNNIVIGFGQPRFYITEVDVGAEGQTGPARMLRWDNLSPGMQINITGILKVQAVPQSSLAPYLSNKLRTPQDRWCPLEAIRLLAAIYEGATPLRRMWTKSNYAKFVAENLAKYITPMNMEDLSRKDERIAEAATAAGILTGLGGFQPRIRQRE